MSLPEFLSVKSVPLLPEPAYLSFLLFFLPSTCLIISLNPLIFFELQVHYAKRFYENLVPSFTIYDLECPDHSFCKFTDDGQYFISFNRNHQDLIVYIPTWLSFSCKEGDCDNTHELSPKAKRFESFFTQLYVRSLASCNELICKDFFLYMESNQFEIFATSTAQIQDAPAVDGAIQGVPIY